MKETITDALDVLALLLVAFGSAALMYDYMGLGSAIVAGVIVGLGSLIASSVADKINGKGKE